MKRIFLISLLILQVSLISGQKDFSFVYLPDMHLRPDSLIISNFERVASQVSSFTLIERTFRARPSLMLLAISIPVTPSGYWRTELSGNVILIM